MRENGTSTWVTICPFGFLPLFCSICWSSLADLTTEHGTICPFGVFSPQCFSTNRIKIGHFPLKNSVLGV